jgi:hypothetical protein
LVGFGIPVGLLTTEVPVPPVVFGGTNGGVPVGFTVPVPVALVPVVVVFPIALLTSAAVPAATAAFFNVLVKLLVGFVVVVGLVVVVVGFVVVVFAATGGLVVVVLAATGAFVVVVLAATGAFVVVVLAATGGFAVTGFAAGVVFAATAGFLIAEVMAGFAAGAFIAPVCTRAAGAPAVVPRGIVAPSETGALLVIASRGARETEVKLSLRPPRSGRPKSTSAGLNF